MDLNYDGMDFGSSGVFYQLGTNFNRMNWKNPDELGYVKAEGKTFFCLETQYLTKIL